MNPRQQSVTNWDEVIESGLAALIGKRNGVLKVLVPPTMPFRAVYLHLEAVATNPAEDFELEASLEFRRNGSEVFSLPASIAENGAASGLLQKSRITAFGNVATGTAEGLLVKLGNPLTNGVSQASLTPQKIQCEGIDEVRLNLLGSRNTSSSFSGWRAVLVVRSSEVPL